jgi:hypothetical protein
MIQLQSFPFQQVFLIIPVYGMEGAYAGIPLEIAHRCSFPEGDIQL